MVRIDVRVEDVRGSFARMVRESPKVIRGLLSTAVFLTAGAVQRHMEADAPLGPDGEGLTPGEHIRQDIEHRGRSGALSAQVGIFDNADQVAVALFNEYRPNQQPFMASAAERESEAFRQRAIQALQRAEQMLGAGW